MKWPNSWLKPGVSFYLLPRNLPRIISNNLLEAYSHLTDGTKADLSTLYLPSDHADFL
jgi:hypothetical protein